MLQGATNAVSNGTCPRQVTLALGQVCNVDFTCPLVKF